MNTKIARRFHQAWLYLERIREDMRRKDPIQGMADAAELNFQAKRLFEEFEAIQKAQK